jgi:hypothetical protein
MSTHQAAPIQKQNRLLAKLPPDELEVCILIWR